MKKQLLLLTMVLFSYASFSQVLINENFDGTEIPSGWYTGANSGSAVWTFGSGEVPGLVGDFTTNAAIFNDDAAGDAGEHNDAYLRTTELMDLSIYDSNLYDLRLKYDYAFNNEEGERLNVELYNGSWNFIKIYTEDANPTTEILNISDYFVNNFALVFDYDDIDNAWGYGAGIDNVELRVMPKNDSCVNAFSVYSFPYSQSLNAEGATNNDGFILYNTEGTDGMNDGVWYKITGDGADYTIQVEPNAWDAEVAVLTGTCGNFTKIANSDEGNVGGTETLTFTSTLGTTYFINVGYWSNATDGTERDFDINITKTCEETTINDHSPATIDACIGDDVSIFVDATGINLSYDWFENGNYIPDEHNPTLNFTNVQEGTASYSYLITNACEDESYPSGGTLTELTVHPTTMITLQPQSVNATIGDDVSFNVSAEGDNLEYLWYKDGNSITGATNSSYEISNVQEADAGIYVVAITGACGNASSNNAVLDVSTSINAIGSKNIEIFPNPANYFLNVKSESIINSILIFDISGKEVIRINPKSNNSEVNVSNLKKGVYFVKIVNENGNYQTKFVKK